MFSSLHARHTSDGIIQPSDEEFTPFLKGQAEIGGFQWKSSHILLLLDISDLRMDTSGGTVR